MLEKAKRNKEWKKVIKNIDVYSFKSSLSVLQKSLEILLDEAFNYMFIPEVERVCFELVETISNLKLMQETDNVNEYIMAKHRVMFMLGNRLETWYM